MAHLNCHSLMKLASQTCTQSYSVDQSIPTMLKTQIHLLTIIQGLILIVYKDAQGHHFEAIAPNGTIYRHSGIFYSASSAEFKGRQRIEELRDEF